MLPLCLTRTKSKEAIEVAIESDFSRDFLYCQSQRTDNVIECNFSSISGHSTRQTSQVPRLASCASI